MLIAKAASYAARAHKNQLRKDGVTPYFYHCSMVAYLVQKYFPDCEQEMVAAAYLHDTIEDCETTVEEIRKEFGDIVAGYVVGLTNVFTKKNYPNLNRKERKSAECQRLKNLSTPVKCIKLADRLANIIDLTSLEKGFQDKFVSETRELLDAIGDTHPTMTAEIRRRLP